LSLEQTPETHMCRSGSKNGLVLEALRVKKWYLQVSSWKSKGIRKKRRKYFRVGDRKL
jgi:hypothetical protein